MNTKTGLYILECEINQLEATVFTLKRCLENLRNSVMSEDERMLKDIHREDQKAE